MTTSVQIRSFLAPPDNALADKYASEFLNTHFPSLESPNLAENTEHALNKAKSELEQLQTQLSESKTRLNALIATTREDIKQHLNRAQELSLLRHTVSDELAYLSQELVSALSDSNEKDSTLLEDIELLHRSLKELESVQSYVQVIRHALSLSEIAVLHLSKSPDKLSMNHEAIQTWRTLKDFVGSVVTQCQTDETASTQKLHLVSFLNTLRDKTWNDFKSTLSSILLAAAEKLNWPVAVNYLEASPADRQAFEHAFANLIKLQRLADSLRPIEFNTKEDREGLYPLESLVVPIALRFKYHFEGTRQTNKLEKPEWYFTHILNAAHEHRAFMESVIQDLVSKTHYRDVVAWREFTRLLLPMITRKLKKTVPTILPHPSLLAHTIYQAISFDAALKEQGFDLPGTFLSRDAKEPIHWKGISDMILSKEQWFDAWLEGERKFAEGQYHEILNAPDAWMIIMDEGSRGIGNDLELRPTNSARRIKMLLEQVTDRYAPLPSALHRSRFMANIQLPILDAYRARMASSLDAFETLASSFVRAVPGSLGVGAVGQGSGADQGVRWNAGVDPQRLTSGVEGLQRLCKALISARYLAGAMEGWGEDLFFLELWAEINRVPSLRARAQNSSLLPPTRGEEAPENTLFDQLIESYKALAVRAEGMAIQHIYQEVESALRAHLLTTASQPPQHEDIQLSPELLVPVSLLSSQLTFLQFALPSATVTGIYRPVATRLATHILQRQVVYRSRGRISPLEGRLIRGECELWVQTCRNALGSTAALSGERVEAPWRRLLEGGRILGADGESWRKIVSTTKGTHDDAVWENVMVEEVGFSELTRQEVQQIIQTRSDA